AYQIASSEVESLKVLASEYRSLPALITPSLLMALQNLLNACFVHTQDPYLSMSLSLDFVCDGCFPRLSALNPASEIFSSLSGATSRLFASSISRKSGQCTRIHAAISAVCRSSFCWCSCPISLPPCSARF